MNPAKGGTTAGGFTCPPSFTATEQGQPKKDLSSDSGAVDSGYLSGQCLSSCEFSSSASIQEESPIDHRFYQSQQEKPKLLTPLHEDDSHTLDSGVDLDSSQQSTGAIMRVENVNELGLHFAKMNVTPYAQPVKFEKYFLQNDEGDTYLHLAVIHEATDVVYKLIRVALQPSWLDIQNDFGQTPLHLSVLTDQPKIVRKLVVSGARPGIRDIEGNTALHLACLHGRTACAKELLAPMNNIELQQVSPAAHAIIKIPQDFEQWNYNGKRCVHIAAETSNIDMLRILVTAGADINSREGKAGLTPLHIAIESSNEKLVQFLLDECPKLRLEAVTYAGLTAYQLAGLQHNQLLLSGLRSRGAEPLTPPESDYEDSDESEEDEQMASYYNRSNVFGSQFPGLSTINVA